jgi:hypothetical protein
MNRFTRIKLAESTDWQVVENDNRKCAQLNKVTGSVTVWKDG